MTNEEAAALLKQTQISLARGNGKVLLAEALRLAISALEERKKGKWIRIPDEVFADRFECSECGKLPPIENFELWLSDYCPNCGADMRGDPNE